MGWDEMGWDTGLWEWHMHTTVIYVGSSKICQLEALITVVQQVITIYMCVIK